MDSFLFFRRQPHADATRRSSPSNPFPPSSRQSLYCTSFFRSIRVCFFRRTPIKINKQLKTVSGQSCLQFKFKFKVQCAAKLLYTKRSGRSGSAELHEVVNYHAERCKRRAAPRNKSSALHPCKLSDPATDSNRFSQMAKTRIQSARCRTQTWPACFARQETAGKAAGHSTAHMS